jgi:hypothetical protein
MSVNTYNNNTYVNPFANNDVFRGEDTYYNFSGWKTFIGSDASSTYINTPLGTGENQEIFYNDTKQTKTYNLGTSKYRDIFGKVVKDSFTLQPFTSKILIGKNFENINQIPAALDQ